MWTYVVKSESQNAALFTTSGTLGIQEGRDKDTTFSRQTITFNKSKNPPDLVIMNHSGKKKNKHHNAKNDPVESKDFEAMFLKVIYEEANGK